MENLSLNVKDELLPVDELKNEILIYYNLENSSIINVKFKNTEKQRAVYKIDSNDKTYCLKKVYYNEENLLYVYSTMEWCFRNGIDVPKLLPTITGSRYVKYKGMLFILTPWLDGEKCDFDNLNHILLSSKTLGRLHKTSRNFLPIEGSARREGFENYSETITKHFHQLLLSINNAHKYDDRFSKLFLDNIDENLELAKLSFEVSSSIDLDNLSRSLCHGDYVNKNILINNNSISLIDFDKCKMDFSARDISYFLRRLLKRENTNWQIDLTLQILDTYRTENELTDSDLKFILAYIAFPQKFWKLSRDYYKNIKKCNKNSFISLMEKSLNKSKNQLDFTYELINSIRLHYNVKI
ncbi:CotS family spore coat protein [Clostridium sp. AL.422]|uniref:CotS family spore coat protein n=1 Tax=Clostridium TaxID=1485 RepID=UPI00293DE9F2|nr:MULTISPECIES: CotS family spore coat protein [unclassified Clostridium]MDV4150118.1 CotS family spore coat protein [Clostridium sp. AL.422]